MQDDFTEFDETFLPGSLDRQYSDSRDYQLLDCVVEGNFEVEEAQGLVDLINSGSMPTKLTEISSKTVTASFGENSLNKTFYSQFSNLLQDRYL